MAKQMHYTKEGYQALVDELDYLKTTRRAEVKEALAVARSYGDLSENSEYDEAKNEQAKLYGRIAEIENILTYAVVIDETTDAEAEDRVGLGCTVKVRDIEFDETDVFAIVGSQEANPMEKRISDDSPFGKAMLGRRIGDIVEVEAPVGVIKFEILDVNR